METNFKRVIQNLSISFILVVLGFLLLSFSTKSVTTTTLDNTSVLTKQISLVITKKTTLEELQKIKKQMMDEGLGFDFSNVVYNEKNEIISISIRYRDANNNSGNYSVSSQKPINDILIVSQGNSISVRSTGNSNQSIINQGSGEGSSNNTDKTYEDRRQQMQERSEQMEREMDERMKAMKERQAEMKNRMQQRRDSISKIEQSPIKNSTYFKGNSHLITKNTTDMELKQLRNSYDAENISFYYKDVQRNGQKQITHISITIDNRNGSISSSGFGNGKDAIKNIIVAVDEQHTIMKNAD